ncbi:MAG: aminotransferase class III-fold pyridoxal phosphate-dependent enzyme [Candidatus Protochlamydia sp.]|nr:aminotransferase class III-fold pyridoxal phosphate-dependent enzyme [Candidatus Protochlamydia sp.]
MFDSDLLNFNKFKKDWRISEAKKLILDALKEHQSQLTEVRPPHPSLALLYHDIQVSFNEMRGGKLFFPYLASGLGNGPLVELMDGSVKYDMISGIGPHYWGHSHPDMISTTINAALNDTVMQGHLQQGIEAFHITTSLLQSSKMDHCFLSSSGAMANENALKIAFQKKFPANRILAFDKCFLGRSLTLSNLTDKPSFRQGLPPSIQVDYIPFYNDDEPERSVRYTVEALKKHLARYPGQHAVMCFELVQGEGGVNAGSREFFTTIMALVREHGIAIFVDEVQTFGRTLELFAYQHYKLDKFVDIVSIGKLSQICATLFRSDFKPQPGLLSQTFTGSTTALQAGHYIIHQLLNGGYFGPEGKISRIHNLFVTYFEELQTRYPGTIQGPFGIGSMIAFTPFDGEFNRVSRFVHDLFHEGVISFIAGSHPTRVRFLIPIGCITPEDVGKVMGIVEKVIIEHRLKKDVL